MKKDFIPDFEIACTVCDGRGIEDSLENGVQNCTVCGGSGFTPTLIGERILSLIGHNLRVTSTPEFRVASGS
jgi:DnaJ-class molecular chaperone